MLHSLVRRELVFTTHQLMSINGKLSVFSSYSQPVRLYVNVNKQKETKKL